LLGWKKPQVSETARLRTSCRRTSFGDTFEEKKRCESRLARGMVDWKSPSI